MQSGGGICTSWNSASKKRKIHPLWYNHVPSLVQNWILAKLKHSFNLFQLHLGCAGKRGVKGMAAVPSSEVTWECPSPNVQTGHRVPKTPELAENHNQNHRLRATLMFSTWQRTHQPTQILVRSKHFRSYQRPAQNFQLLSWCVVTLKRGHNSS